MSKAITLSTICVLLVSTTAFAAVDNITHLNYVQSIIGSTVHVDGPAAFGNANQTIGLNGLSQFGNANSGQTFAGQGIGGLLTQSGVATSNGAGGMDVDQELAAETVGVTIDGVYIPQGQNQTMEGNGDGLQTQAVQVSGTQELDKKTGGNAFGSGVNVIRLGLGQGQGGTGTVMGQNIAINGSQMSTLTGAANGDGKITTALTIVVAQGEQVN